MTFIARLYSTNPIYQLPLTPRTHAPTCSSFLSSNMTTNTNRGEQEERTAEIKEEKRGTKRRHISGLHSRPLRAARSCTPSTRSPHVSERVASVPVVLSRTCADGAFCFPFANSNDTDDVAARPFAAVDIRTVTQRLSRTMTSIYFLCCLCIVVMIDVRSAAITL